MEFLPDDVLLDVFRHINKNCDKIKQVCKRFYMLICELNRNKCAMVISDKELQDKGIYDSMVYSKKLFYKIILNSNNIQSLDSFWKLRTICSLKAETVTELLWDSAKMTSTELSVILNFFPNLKTLKCNSWKIPIEYYDEPIETLKLSSLESLSIIRCDEATTEFFTNHLPINCLKKLETDFYSPDLISRQTTLNELSLNVEEIPPNNWISVPLRHLSMRLQKYRNHNNPIILTILKELPHLISFDVINCNGLFDNDDASLEVMCNMKDLRILKINIDDVNHFVFKENFGKLDKLEELHIESVDSDYSSLIENLIVISNTKLNHLRILNIDVEHANIPLDRIERMGKYFPILSKLTYKCERPLPIDIFLNNFKALTDLEINYHYSQEFSLMCLNLDNHSFPLIHRIQLKGFNFGSDANLNEPAFTKLVKVLPNVSIMEIEVNMPLNTKLLDTNLQRLPKLKTFKDLTLVQQKENYEKFDIYCVSYFLSVAEKLEAFSVEFKLKAIDMDVHDMKTMLMDKFQYNMKRYGSQIVINLEMLHN